MYWRSRLSRLRDALQEKGYVLRIDLLDERSDKDCFIDLLNRAIDFRSEDKPEASLIVLQWLIGQGFEHALIIQNQIFGLISLGHCLEAMSLLPALSLMQRDDLLVQARDFLLLHQHALVVSLQSHCDYWGRDPIVIPDSDFHSISGFFGVCFGYAWDCIQHGDEPLALALIEEIIQRGWWSEDDVSDDILWQWARLVVVLASTVLTDMALYEVALRALKRLENIDAKWLLAQLEARLALDICDEKRAQALMMPYLIGSKKNDNAWQWWSSQQMVADHSILAEPYASELAYNDQVFIVNEQIYNYFLKLTDGFVD